MNQPLSQTFRESSDISYGCEVKGTFRIHEKFLMKLAKEENHLIFFHIAMENNIIPKCLRPNTPFQTQTVSKVMAAKEALLRESKILLFSEM
jgi:hypothetical protein